MEKRELGAALGTYPTALAYCHIAKLLRPWVNREGVTFLGMLVIGSEYKINDYRIAAEVLLRAEVTGGFGRYKDRIAVHVVKKGHKDFDDLLIDIHQHKPILYFFEDPEDVPAELAMAADVYSVLPRPDIVACKAAVFHICGSDISDEDAEYLLDESWRRTAPVFRKGRPASRSLKLLRSNPPPVRRLTEKKPVAARAREKPRGLEDMVGYGQAARWGLQLAKELAAYRVDALAWSDIDNGLLLSGPPGVGKTKFAEALAISCGVPIVHGSAAVWQSAGFLNDMLRAMRDCFDRAAQSAPCILLIDEVDAFGSRSGDDSHNKSYSRQVIAGLLQCLDGAIRRDGVVVVGTANYPEHLDPAICRPGRLDRHIALEFPDPPDRLVILEQYLGVGLMDDSAVNDFVTATVGWSGADIERLAREGRRRARIAGRAVIDEDVIKSLPEVAQIDVERLATTAIHEAGHAVFGLAVGRVIERITLSEKYLRASGAVVLGGVRFHHPEFPRRTAEWYLDEIGISLAGIAAEREITGLFDDGAGGVISSDLVVASRLATAFEGGFGMGESLLSGKCETDADIERILLRNPMVAQRADALLIDQMDHVTSVIVENLSAVEALSREMGNRKRMTGDQILEFFRTNGLAVAKAKRSSAIEPGWSRRQAT